MTLQPTPADAQRLRVEYTTQKAFLTDHGVIPENSHPSRQDIRDGIRRLTPGERTILQKRLTENRRRLTDLMDGERKTFDEPHADADDLPDDYANAWRDQ